MSTMETAVLGYASPLFGMQTGQWSVASKIPISLRVLSLPPRPCINLVCPGGSPCVPPPVRSHPLVQQNVREKI